MYRNRIKRLLDILLSACGILCLSWLLLLLAVAIKLDSPGPVFFRQKRVGIGKRHFQILKFRTMRIDTPHDMPTHLLHDPDQYITRMGHFLRKTSLDELPQLINILRGDMSFIGPRPERPEIIAQYMEVMPEFAFRMKVKAGLAGFAQVYGKYNTTPYDKLKLDLFYIENYSFLLDIKLLFMTVKIFFQKEVSEGVDDDQKNALKDSQDKSVSYTHLTLPTTSRV